MKQTLTETSLICMHGSTGSLSGAAESPPVYTEGGWPTAAARGRRSRRQGGTEGDGRGAEPQQQVRPAHRADHARAENRTKTRESLPHRSRAAIHAASSDGLTRSGRTAPLA